MRLSEINMKGSVSLLLSLTLVTMFSATSLAAPSDQQPKADTVPGGSVAPTLTGALTGSPVLPVLTGQLTVKKGKKVSVDGNSAETGATILSGSRIVTGKDEVAIVDLGDLGRIEIRDNTTVTITFTPGDVHIKSDCDRTRIEVTRGEVDVKQPTVQVLLADNKGTDKENKETYGGSVEATTAGATDFIVDCGGKPPGLILAGWWGLAGLVSVGAAMAVGVVTGGPSGPPRLSPVI
ncbi:MAG TPA: hypothetical protein VGV87_08740 [Blastocatellia bacterium]|jgi:hypothetical protein|nr:hypothetical protein [Blastocatellia bacterium]